MSTHLPLLINITISITVVVPFGLLLSSKGIRLIVHNSTTIVSSAVADTVTVRIVVQGVNRIQYHVLQPGCVIGDGRDRRLAPNGRATLLLMRYIGIVRVLIRVGQDHRSYIIVEIKGL